MPNKNKFYNGHTRKALRDFLSDYLPKEHYNRNKSILTDGLLSNFAFSDLKIVKNEYKNINKELLDLVDTDKLKNIFKKLDNSIKISEEELIDLQIFVSANTFKPSQFIKRCGLIFLFSLNYTLWIKKILITKTNMKLKSKLCGLNHP